MSMSFCPAIDRSLQSLLTALLVALPTLSASGDEPLPVALHLTNDAAVDQDDLCFWTCMADSMRSLAIVSDKSANLVFVYDATGKLIQSVRVAQPGNIDLRSGFPLGGQLVPLVAVNERATNKLAVFALDPSQSTLSRIDDDTIDTGENYGGALGQLPATNRFFFVSTSKENGVSLFELRDNGRGRVAGEKVRHWDLGMCEGAVADDESRSIYVSVEAEGVYRLPLDPSDASPPEKVIAVGTDGFMGDVEGISLLSTRSDRRYLIVSDQGSSRFRVHGVEEGYPLKAVLAIAGVTETDGVDVIPTPFGSVFPHGALACHSDTDDGKTMCVVDLALVLAQLK